MINAPRESPGLWNALSHLVREEESEEVLADDLRFFSSPRSHLVREDEVEDGAAVSSEGAVVDDGDLDITILDSNFMMMEAKRSGESGDKRSSLDIHLAKALRAAREDIGMGISTTVPLFPTPSEASVGRSLTPISLRMKDIRSNVFLLLVLSAEVFLTSSPSALSEGRRVSIRRPMIVISWDAAELVVFVCV